MASEERFDAKMDIMEQAENIIFDQIKAGASKYPRSLWGVP